MDFLKLQAYGNDYVVFDERWIAGIDPLNEFMRRVCSRHYGVGADGVAVIGRAGSEADFTVLIFNADGGEAAMSGNGTRSAAAYLYYQGLWSQDRLRLSTRAGIKLYQLRERKEPGYFRFEAEIGRPCFDSAAIPMLTEKPLPRVLNYPIVVDDEIIHVTALQMCNPNCCVFVADFDAVDWRRLGSALETHKQFPERTNVEFVRVRDHCNIEVRVWERGVGETLSSGTGACAAAVAACINNHTERRVNVVMPGGELRVEWRADEEVLLTGAVEVVFRGEWLLPNGDER